MAIKFEKIEAGMTLYERHRYKMGNTMLSTLGEWKVKVIEVDRKKRMVLYSWNGNSPGWNSARNVEKFHTWSMYDKSIAEIETGMMGAVLKVRKLTKAEQEKRK